jgi:hypothetical protein
MSAVFRDGLNHAMQIAYEAPSDFAAKVAAMIQYSAWCGDDGGDPPRPLLDVGQFRRLLSLVILDYFSSSSSEEEKAKRMAPLYREDVVLDGTEVSAESIALVRRRVRALRKHASYQPMLAEVSAQAKALSGATTMDKAAEVLEPVAVAVATESMLFGKADERANAAREFYGRRSAMKSREDKDRDKVLPENFVQGLELGARLLAGLLAQEREHGVVIDATKLNVPALPASNEEGT